jgi:peptidyl-prolyl cis-trans isomerase C
MISLIIVALIALFLPSVHAFVPTSTNCGIQNRNVAIRRADRLQMNFFDDAFRFFTNMNKEASAKHILLKGDGALEKLEAAKQELMTASDLNSAFSEMAAKISECPSATRGGNLGTFKPGMMVKEFDEIVFGQAVGQVHGPIKTQFGNHLILITRRYEGEDTKK